jgi:hypothetical protein
LKVLIPSVVALLLVFAAIYALTRNSTPGNANANQQVPALAADPNSQPVQPTQPATGKGEEGIPSGGAIRPPAIASPSASVAASPAEDFTPDANANANSNTNSNANENGNSNRKAPALPEPTRSVVPGEAPPPVPAPTKPPAEKPSPTATPPSNH